MVEAPIFHVNGDDPEAVVHAVRVATKFRQKFRQGRGSGYLCTAASVTTEGDEPMFTNPAMYIPAIKAPQDHAATLHRASGAGRADPRGRDRRMPRPPSRPASNDEFEAGKEYKPNKADWLDGRWSHPQPRGRGIPARRDGDQTRDHGRDRPRRLTKRARALHPAQDRRTPARDEAPDVRDRPGLSTGPPPRHWPSAASLTEGYPRFASPDRTVRAAPSRNATRPWSTRRPRDRYYRSTTFREGQQKYEVIDSMLLGNTRSSASNTATASAEPNALVAWEAQFRRFRQRRADHVRSQVHLVGRTQVAADVGPHHDAAPPASRVRAPSIFGAPRTASCRCAPRTTGSSPTARRPPTTSTSCAARSHRSFRKPLVLMTPKSLLRHKLAISGDAADFTTGSSFHRVLWDDAEKGHSDTTLAADDKIRRVVIMLGQGLFRPARGTRRPRHRRCLPPAPRTVLSLPGARA